MSIINKDFTAIIPTSPDNQNLITAAVTVIDKNTIQSSSDTIENIYLCQIFKHKETKNEGLIGKVFEILPKHLISRIYV